MIREKIKSRILNASASEFNDLSLEVFHYQYQNNRLYRQYVDLLQVEISKIERFYDIPCLPIRFFKEFSIQTGNFIPEIIFESSGTTSDNTSKHGLRENSWYEQISTLIFENEFGPLSDFRILALLPSYLERSNSSLVQMVRFFLERNGNKGGFYLNDFDKLIQQLQQPFHGTTLLIGVSFALLDLAENHPMDLKNTIIMETGGMKGRRKEMTRQELHTNLSRGLNIDKIHSEYGMTELLSQFYSRGNGRFKCHNQARVWTRELSDPFCKTEKGRVGALNIVDLANLDSICFVATDDLGKIEGNEFEVLGRMDDSDVRGCNLLYH